MQEYSGVDLTPIKDFLADLIPKSGDPVDFSNPVGSDFSKFFKEDADNSCSRDGR